MLCCLHQVSIRILFVLVLVFAVVACILLNSTTNDTIYFHYVNNQNTGEQIGAVTSIFLYILLWWLIGTLFASFVFLCMLCLYYFLHRKDKRLFERHYHPKYEEEFYYGGTVSFVAAYAAVFVLLVLHISNIATITVF